MTLDSSALIAVLFSEPGYLSLVDRMLEAETLRIGTPTLVETSLVFESRRGTRDRQPSRAGKATRGSAPLHRDEVHELVKELGVTVVPFGEPDWHRAVDAFSRYGRGRHRSSLNFGDCLAYATAAAAGDSLLYVGDDFKHTDLPPAP
jgi:ribonuclease VapC